MGTDGIIVVDTQFAPLYDKIKAKITSLSPLPVKYVIFTHYHGDHTGGAEPFAKDGATLVSTAIDPNELNAVVVDLQRKPGVRHATWEVSTKD